MHKLGGDHLPMSTITQTLEGCCSELVDWGSIENSSFVMCTDAGPSEGDADVVGGSSLTLTLDRLNWVYKNLKNSKIPKVFRDSFPDEIKPILVPKGTSIDHKAE